MSVSEVVRTAVVVPYAGIPEDEAPPEEVVPLGPFREESVLEIDGMGIPVERGIGTETLDKGNGAVVGLPVGDMPIDEGTE